MGKQLTGGKADGGFILIDAVISICVCALLAAELLFVGAQLAGAVSRSGKMMHEIIRENNASVLELYDGQ